MNNEPVTSSIKFLQIPFGNNVVIHAMMHLFKQMQLPSVMPTLAQAVAQYTSMLLAALVEKLTSLTALKFALESTVCKATLRMLE